MRIFKADPEATVVAIQRHYHYLADEREAAARAHDRYRHDASAYQAKLPVKASSPKKVKGAKS